MKFIVRHPWLTGSVALLVLVLLPFALWAFGLEFRARTAGFVGSRQAEVTIESASNRIAQYEMFYDKCAAIEGYEAQIQLLQDQLSETSSENQDEITRLRTSIAGLEGQRARAIAEYNAESSKDYTAARFKASDLPWHLSLDKETVCNASYNTR